jgi:hypothetical protein
MKTKIMILFFFSIILFSCSIQTSFRETRFKKTYKDCGFILSNRYYDSEILEFNLLVPNVNKNNDYYHYYKGIYCFDSLNVSFITIECLNFLDTIKVINHSNNASFFLNRKLKKSEFKKIKEIEIKVFYDNGKILTKKMQKFRYFFTNKSIFKLIYGG